MMMKTLFATMCVGLLLAEVAWAGEKIMGTQQETIQTAMNKHIEDMIERNGNGKYPVFDSDLRTLVQLKFKELHEGVERMGKKTPYFVSCADFVAADGTLYDLDFFVSEKYGVVSAIVHAKNGVESKYDVH
ncbi:MAG: hypothetical protein SGJ16_12915 [Nitrospirota bacterium]|nr:hypothetical protein [Nitrospirota bacterium]